MLQKSISLAANVPQALNITSILTDAKTFVAKIGRKVWLEACLGADLMKPIFGRNVFRQMFTYLRILDKMSFQK
jgi:hypothetical protein